MRMIAEYKTVSSYTLDGLDRGVNELVTDGWEPVGSATIVRHEAFNIYQGNTSVAIEYLQNMVRYEEA